MPLTIKKGMNNVKITKGILFLAVVIFSNSYAYAASYISNTELGKLPKIQQDFTLNLVRAYQANSPRLMNRILHSDILNNTECSNLMHDNFRKGTIPGSYAVKVKPGRKEGALYFKIRHESVGKAGARTFKMFKNVVNENGRLVINMNCEATLKFLNKVKNK